jgi:hypothetical protein
MPLHHALLTDRPGMVALPIERSGRRFRRSQRWRERRAEPLMRIPLAELNVGSALFESYAAHREAA